MNRYQLLSKLLVCFVFTVLFSAAFSKTADAACNGLCSLEDFMFDGCPADCGIGSSCGTCSGPPPADRCDRTGTTGWDFKYNATCVVDYSDINSAVCNYHWQQIFCSAADRCEGATGGGGTGYAGNGHVLAGDCDASRYTPGGNPTDACINGGYYKQCCSSGGDYPVTTCSNGICPSGSITSPNVTWCQSPQPTPPPTPTPPPAGTAGCDSGCGTCGYRNSDTSCTTDNSCCHRVCNGNACTTIFGGGANDCDNDSQCGSPPTPAPTPAPAVTLSGRITNSVTGAGISGIVINEGSDACLIGTATTNGQGDFQFPGIPAGQPFCMRGPLSGVPGLTNPFTYNGGWGSYECQTAGMYVDLNGTCGSHLDQAVDNTYNFTYTPIVPPTPNITKPACINSGYDGSGVTISWTNNSIPATYADISTDNNFATYYHKAVSGSANTAASTSGTGFNGYQGVSGTLYFNPNTAYYVRLYNGYAHGPAAPFSSFLCVPAAPANLSAACPSPGNEATLSWTALLFADHYALRLYDTAIGWDSPASCTDTANLQTGSICNDNVIASPYFFTATKNQTSLQGHTYGWWLHACNAAGCGSATTGANFTCSDAITPWIQITGGDVHSNTRINAPGGP